LLSRVILPLGIGAKAGVPGIVAFGFLAAISKIVAVVPTSSSIEVEIAMAYGSLFMRPGYA